MTKISKFKAMRPVRDKVHLVATRPYYTYKKNVLKAKLEDNPYTFLHIINPEFANAVKTKPNSKERFEQVKHAYQEFVEQGIFVKDQVASIYIYRQTKEGHQFTGVVAGASIEEYNRDSIKKHEATLTSREEMFVNYLDQVGFNAEPVLLSYTSTNDIKSILSEITRERPEYEFTTTDRITHELWIVQGLNADKIQHYFEEIDAVYIADGHHRSASSAGLIQRRIEEGRSNFENENSFLAFFIDETELQILEFNRVVRKLSISTQDLLEKLSEHFTVEVLKARQKPKCEHQITMCLKGKWYNLLCRSSCIIEDHPVKKLDADILTQFILTPILGIQDLKTDQNIEFIPGVEPIDKIEKSVNQGKYEVAFFLFPTTIEEVKSVADHNLIMPPKSTWVEPKLRSGLTIYEINE